MTRWRKVLAWETVEEPTDYVAEADKALKLSVELDRLKEAGDESVHTYSVSWTGWANGTSYVLGHNIEEAKMMQEYGYDSGFEQDDTGDWESRGIHCSETGEEYDW